MAMKALGHQMTRTVRVNRQVLIETLLANREKHIAAFNEAMAGYKEIAVQKIHEAFEGLTTKLAQSKTELLERIATFTPETASQFSDHLTILQGVSVHLQVPVSYADAYDAAIDMAKFDTREELDLSGAEFQCFCRDVWDWSYEFAARNLSYAGYKNS